MEKQANTTTRPFTVVLHESLYESVLSDICTFIVTASLVLIADGKSLAWQVITIGMFVFWVFAKAGIFGKIHRFYSKREVLKWAESLPEPEQGEKS